MRMWQKFSQSFLLIRFAFGIQIFWFDYANVSLFLHSVLEYLPCFQTGDLNETGGIASSSTSLMFKAAISRMWMMDVVHEDIYSRKRGFFHMTWLLISVSTKLHIVLWKYILSQSLESRNHESKGHNRE